MLKYLPLKATRPPLPSKVGQPARYDFEYERHGSCNLFMIFQPSAGWRTIKVTAHRKQEDFALLMRELVEVHFPNATHIRVVLDTLNSHSPASLYAAFEPAQALRILQKLEFHSTPKPGAWLNMVEIEVSILVRQCLGQRSPAMASLACQVTAWQDRRNAQHATIHWQFSVHKARPKLTCLYPSPSLR